MTRLRRRRRGKQIKLQVTSHTSQGPSHNEWLGPFFLMSDRPAGNPRGTRSAVLARNGVIATSQPLASAAGLQVLQSGGNAVDAAVTAAAVLAVVEPTMTGVGGDVFAIVYDSRTKRLRGLNSSGRAGARADADALIAKGISKI